MYAMVNQKVLALTGKVLLDICLVILNSNFFSLRREVKVMIFLIGLKKPLVIGGLFVNPLRCNHIRQLILFGKIMCFSGPKMSQISDHSISCN